MAYDNIININDGDVFVAKTNLGNIALLRIIGKSSGSATTSVFNVEGYVAK
jgi:hypothetical protein